jgi:MoaA/NifB/PqqE/SkfB family radical SAM enzyme
MEIVKNLKVELEKKYNIECYISIEDLEQRPSSTLYQTLVSFVRDPYEPDYRFVFFNFAPIHKKTLEHISQTIAYLDISPSFILVMTNQITTVEYFSKRSEPITTETVSVPESTAIADPVPRFDDGSLCAYAWAGVHVYTDGKVRPCCDFSESITDDLGQPYNIKSTSLNEIASSSYMKSLREEFTKGRLPSGCSNCKKIESAGGASRRQLSKYKLKNLYGLIDWESDQSTIRYVGGHTGNLCNLKCRICSPNFSSSIAIEELKGNQSVHQILKDTRWTKNSDKFWKELKTLVPTACSFEFLGGEPLMLKENIDFMQYLVDTGHSKNSIFEFVTNGTRYEKILDDADQFYRLAITVSIDDINERFELERFGADWLEVESNVDRYISVRDKSQSLILGINTTVSIQNVFYLPELLSWLDQKQIDHHHFNVLNFPAHLSVQNLTPTAKNLVLKKLKSCNDNRLDMIINFVEQSITSDGKEFCLFMKNKDQLRNENFAISHPEIAEAMGYI